MAFTITQLWSSAVAQSIYIRQTGLVQTGPIAGVMSCSLVDITNYDQDVYRDTSDITSPWPAFIQHVLAGGPPYAALTPTPYQLGLDTYATKLLTKTTEAGVETKADIPIADATDAVTTLDDRASHIPPRSTQKTRSMYLWWSGATGTGNVLASCWADEFISTSLAEFNSIT